MPAKVTSLAPISVTAELLILPYTSANGGSVIERLIAELETGGWDSFRCALAFGKQSGNIPALIAAMDAFLARGGKISVTFGADSFAGRTKGTDLLAVRELLERLSTHLNFALNLYYEGKRTFHPKVYFFDEDAEGRGLLIIGSSNWSEGGLFDNVEANALLSLDYSEPNHKLYREAIIELFDDFWGDV